MSGKFALVIFFLVLALRPGNAQTVLGKHPADVVVPAFYNQNSNAETTVAGINRAKISVTNVPIATISAPGIIRPDGSTLVTDPVTGITSVVGGGAGSNTNALTPNQQKQLTNSVTVTTDTTMTATSTVSAWGQTNLLLGVKTNLYDLAGTGANAARNSTNNFPAANIAAGGTASISITGTANSAKNATNGPDGNPLLTYANNAFYIGGMTNKYLATNAEIAFYNTVYTFDPTQSSPTNRDYGYGIYPTLVYTNQVNGTNLYLVFNDINITTDVAQICWSLSTSFPDDTLSYDYVNTRAGNPTNVQESGAWYWVKDDSSSTLQVLGSGYAPAQKTLVVNTVGDAQGTFEGTATGVFNGTFSGDFHPRGVLSAGSLTVSNNARATFYAGELGPDVSNSPPSILSYNVAPTLAFDGSSITMTNTANGDALHPNWVFNYIYMNARSHNFWNTNWYDFGVSGQSMQNMTNRYMANGHLVSPAVTGRPGFWFYEASGNDFGTATNVFISAHSNYLNMVRADGWKIYTTPQWSNAWYSSSWATIGVPDNNWLLAHTNMVDGLVRGDLFFSTNQNLLQGGPHPTSGLYWSDPSTQPYWDAGAAGGAAQLAKMFNTLVTPAMTAWTPPANSLIPGATMNGVILATTSDVKNATNNLPNGAFYPTNTYDLAGTANAIMLANAPGYQTAANVNALILNATNSFGTAARQSTSAFDAAGAGAAAALNATNNLGSSAFKNTNTFDLAGTGAAAATAATNGLAKTNAPILLNPLLVYPTNNLATMNVIDMSKAYSSYTTNADFIWGLPINVNASAVNVTAVFVTNSSGSLRTMTPNTSWGAHTNGGAWNVTNVTVVQLTTFGFMWTNAISLPLW